MSTFLTHAAIAVTVWAFIYAVIVWPICALAKRAEERRAFTTTPEGAQLALLLAKAYAEGRVQVGEPICVESVEHPSGARIPIRVYGESAVGDVLAEEAAEWMDAGGAA